MRDRIGRAVYYSLRAFTKAVVFSFARWEVVNAELLPSEGGLVLVSNHKHLLDPPLIAASAQRRLHPMAKREPFETPLIGWILWLYGAFPVRRFSADIGALRAARNHLRAGKVVLMFPEGTRSLEGEGMKPAMPGAAMVALLAGVKVVPVAVTGTERIKIPGVLFLWLRRRRLTFRIVFGEPFELPSKTAEARQAEEATDFMMRRVAALLPQSYQGAYGASSEGTLVFARQQSTPPDAGSTEQSDTEQSGSD